MDADAKSSRICVSCQRDISNDALFCPYCGHSYGDRSRLQTGRSVSSILPIVGGLAILVAGLIDLGNGLLSFANTGPYLDNGVSELLGMIYLYAIVLIFSGVVAVIAGSRAMQRRNLAFSLAGGFVSVGVAGLSLLSYSYLSLFYTSQLGLIGIILIAIARDEFDS